MYSCRGGKINLGDRSVPGCGDGGLAPRKAACCSGGANNISKLQTPGLRHCEIYRHTFIDDNGKRRHQKVDRQRRVVNLAQAAKERCLLDWSVSPTALVSIFLRSFYIEAGCRLALSQDHKIMQLQSHASSHAGCREVPRRARER